MHMNSEMMNNAAAAKMRLCEVTFVRDDGVRVFIKSFCDNTHLHRHISTMSLHKMGKERVILSRSDCREQDKIFSSHPPPSGLKVFSSFLFCFSSSFLS